MTERFDLTFGSAARRGAYRVRHRVDDDTRLVTVVDIAYRADAYHPGRS